MLVDTQSSSLAVYWNQLHYVPSKIARHMPSWNSASALVVTFRVSLQLAIAIRRAEINVCSEKFFNFSKLLRHKVVDSGATKILHMQNRKEDGSP
jgi:hypothetical protein